MQTSPALPLKPAPTNETRAAGNERVLAGQKRALELAVRGAPLGEVLEVLVHTLEDQSTRGVLGSILVYDPSEGRLRHGAGPSLPVPYCQAIDGIEIGPTVGSCGTAAFSRQTVIVEDIETHPFWVNFKALATGHGLRACWSKPILSVTGEVLATFAIYHRHPAIPADRDLEVVELLAHTAALVIERDQQTRRLEAAEAALRKSHAEQFASMVALFEHAPAAIAVTRGREHVFEVANPRYAELVGNRQLMGRSVREAFPELEGQGFLERLDEVRRSGRPFLGRAMKVPIRRGLEGPLEDRYFDFVYQPIPETSGSPDRIMAVAFEVTEMVRAR